MYTKKARLYKPIPKDVIKSKAVPPSVYTISQLATIYNFPTTVPNKKTVIGVISFGGGLFGTMSQPSSSGAMVLTNGDVQECWKSLHIPSNNWPQVIIAPYNGVDITPLYGQNGINDNGTGENTLDVSTIGAVYPSSNLTIILYLASNYTGFDAITSYALNTPVIMNGVSYTPDILSISWGAPEKCVGLSDCISANIVFSTAVSRGITICTASGDDGSADGMKGKNVDFPSSSPNVLACGGTTLQAPTLSYDATTKETAWDKGGGGVSAFFGKPFFQTTTNSNFRCVPDISLNADPNTGVLYIIQGQIQKFGGTSIVAPMMAGYLGMLGVNFFVNSKLYTIQNRNCFHDIISGSNGDYNATVNFDCCTGLGSIDGKMLGASLLSLQQSVSKKITIPIGYSYPIPLQVSWKSSNGNVTIEAGMIVARVIGVTVLTSNTMTITVNVISVPNGW
jgi:kumamolisin